MTHLNTTQQVEVEHYRTSLFHWPSIVAGAFVALALLVISVVLARACDVDVTFMNATSRSGEVGAIVWGAVAAFICFGIGGLIAGRSACVTRHGSGWLNGLLVWAVAVPLLVYFLGSGIGPRLGQTAELGRTNVGQHTAMQAAARYGPVSPVNGEFEQPAVSGSPTRVSHAQAAAWWMLLSLGLGLVAATGMGFVSARPRTY